MLFSYLKIGIRNIVKYKVFSFINLFGLALAMSACMLIVLMLVDQKSYDQFNEKRDRTFRILSMRKGSAKPNASSPFPLASTLKASYPIIEEATSLRLGVGGDALYDEHTVPMRGFFADPSFFNVFDYELEKGSKDKALELANSVVITSAFANLLFNEENPVGKTIEFTDRGLGIINMLGKEVPPVRWGSYVVTGVIADKNYKSHLKFDALVSSSSMKVLQDEKKIEDITQDWATYSRTYTYIVLASGKSANDLNTALTDIVAQKYKKIEHLQGFKLIEQGLTSITPGIYVGNPSSLSLPIDVYYYLASLAIVIMLSACLNYIYLSTARSLIRAKEIGVRKAVGANQRSLIFQFLSESMITAFLAMLVASGLLFFFLKSAFLNLWVNQYLNFDLQPNGTVFIIFIALAITIGLISGGYPALHLSKYKPTAALKGTEIKQPGRLTFGMMKVLSSLQFIISLFFITTSILIFKQFRHFLEFKYEFNPSHIVNIPLQANTYQTLFNEFSAVPGVYNISACSFIPATGMAHGATIRKMGSEETYVQSEILHVDENFFDNLELKVIAGQNLPSVDKSAADFVVVNQATLTALGYKHPSEIVGQLLDFGGTGVKVMGVVENFRFQTPMTKDEIGPLVLMNRPGEFNFVNVKIASDDLMATVKKLAEKWKSIDDVHPFKYQFFDEELRKANQSLGDLVSIIGYSSILAITIACLGVFGMVTYTTQRREKEVSVRKVLGADDTRILFLLSKEFLALLGISILISAPLTYYVNLSWLESFPNRVDFGIGIICLGIVILLLFGCVAIGAQTIRASKQRPVNSLKVE
jgi:putative ABC transport system permease protein